MIEENESDLQAMGWPSPEMMLLRVREQEKEREREKREKKDGVGRYQTWPSEGAVQDQWM